MEAEFKIDDELGEGRIVITVLTDPEATWPDGKRGAVNLILDWEAAPERATLPQPSLILRQSEARAIASALMGAAAEL